MAYCRNCYKELSFGEIVCSGCGKKIDTPLFSLPDDVGKSVQYNTNDRSDLQPQNADVQKSETFADTFSQDTPKRKVVYCTSCGASIDEQAIICVKCGTQQRELKVSNGSTQNSSIPFFFWFKWKW